MFFFIPVGDSILLSLSLSFSFFLISFSPSRLLTRYRPLFIILRPRRPLPGAVQSISNPTHALRLAFVACCTSTTIHHYFFLSSYSLSTFPVSAIAAAEPAVHGNMVQGQQLSTIIIEW